jgi:hypothetical protein
MLRLERRHSGLLADRRDDTVTALERDVADGTAEPA